MDIQEHLDFVQELVARHLLRYEVQLVRFKGPLGLSVVAKSRNNVPMLAIEAVTVGAAINWNKNVVTFDGHDSHFDEIRPGDEIVLVNGEASSSAQMQLLLNRSERVTLRISRNTPLRLEDFPRTWCHTLVGLEAGACAPELAAAIACLDRYELQRKGSSSDAWAHLIDVLRLWLRKAAREKQFQQRTEVFYLPTQVNGAPAVIDSKGVFRIVASVPYCRSMCLADLDEYGRLALKGSAIHADLTTNSNWLRVQLLEEFEVQQLASLTAELMTKHEIFRHGNKFSFLKAVAEVRSHLMRRLMDAAAAASATKLETWAIREADTNLAVEIIPETNDNEYIGIV